MAVPRGAEHVGLNARTLHEAGNWLLITDCFHSFATVRRTVVLAEMANCLPALMPLLVNFLGHKTSSGVFFRMDSGETRTIACSCSIQHGDPMKPATFYPGTATGAEAFQRGAETGRSGNLRVHERRFSQPYGGHGHHG